VLELLEPTPARADGARARPRQRLARTRLATSDAPSAAWREQVGRSWLSRSSFADGYKSGSNWTVSVADCVVPLYEAEMLTFLESSTIDVLTVKFAVVAPAGTVTLAGTDAVEGSLLESAITAPPAGAGPFSLTVPVELWRPPVTVVGFSVSEERTAGTTVSVAVRMAPP
jgi:hypothetical protein